jgi:hypothetical protein
LELLTGLNQCNAFVLRVYAAGTLHAHGTLTSAQGVTAGNSFSFAPFSIQIPAA